jgi:hypothetical protein
VTDWRAVPEMGYEQTYGYERNGKPERDLSIYIKGSAAEQYDYVKRMANGTACPSCAAAFPAPCDLASLKVWRAECPNLFAQEWLARSAESRIAKGFCPFCEFETSTEAFNLLVTGAE